MTAIKLHPYIYIALCSLLFAGCTFKAYNPLFQAQPNNNYKHYSPNYSKEGKYLGGSGEKDFGHNNAGTNDRKLNPYKVYGIQYVPKEVKVGDTFEGIASWYGPNFHAKKTANGEMYSMYQHTAAHKTFPMHTMVKVTNKENQKSTIVRINDRGPFVDDRIIDLSKVAAIDIDMVGKGTAPVTLEVIQISNKNTPLPKTNKHIENKPTFENEQIFEDVMDDDKVIEKSNEIQTDTMHPMTPQEMPLDDISLEQQDTKKGVFYIQIEALTNKDNALLLKDQYSNIGGKESLIKESSLNGEIIYKIWVGAFPTKEAAYDFADMHNMTNKYIIQNQ